jgi:hypothetical protein
LSWVSTNSALWKWKNNWAKKDLSWFSI